MVEQINTQPQAIAEASLATRGNFLHDLRRNIAVLSTAAVAAYGVGSMLANPETAQADCTPTPNGQTCSSSSSQECTTTQENNEPPVTVCKEDGSSESGTTPPEASTPPKTDSQPKPKPHHPAHHPKPKPQPKPQSVFSDQWNFRGYDMGASSFTDHNGCFITSTSSALRRVTGDAHIRPRVVYNTGELRGRWSPSSGVIDGGLYDTLPAIGAHFGVKEHAVSFAAARLALKHGGQIVIRAAPGHFAGGSGHYMVGRKSLPNGNILIDDPNGDGKSHDSERRRGWSGRELAANNVIGYYALTKRHA